MEAGVLQMPDLRLRIVLCRWRHMTQWGWAQRVSPIWRLYWNPTPGAWVQWQDQHVDLGPEVGVLVPPQTPFAAGHDRPFDHFFLHFLLGYEYQLHQPGLFPRHLNRTDARQLRLLAARARQTAPGGATDGLLAHNLILRWLQNIPANAWRGPVQDARVRQAMALVQARLPITLSNDELAAAVHAHPSTLVRLFRDELGQSPHRYALRLRLDAACRQLLATADSVETVAERCGFADRFHLTRAMSRHLDTTPGRLRERMA